jgi:hypothetical protein
MKVYYKCALKSCRAETALSDDNNLPYEYTFGKKVYLLCATCYEHIKSFIESNLLDGIDVKDDPLVSKPSGVTGLESLTPIHVYPNSINVPYWIQQIESTDTTSIPFNNSSTAIKSRRSWWDI